MRQLNFLKIGLLGLGLFCALAAMSQTVNRSAVYAALASSKTSVLDAQLSRLNDQQADGRAFKGALLMRKAGTVPIPAKKLSLFKQGHRLLEAAIAAAPQNVEYRFLRLMIQENAPRNLGYNKSIPEDSRTVRNGYADLPALVQKRVYIYSKQSKALPSSALKRES